MANKTRFFRRLIRHDAITFPNIGCQVFCLSLRALNIWNYGVLSVIGLKKENEC